MKFQTPSNFKDARLIIGIFRLQDLIYLIVSAVITLALVLFYLIGLEGTNFVIFSILLIPAILAGIFTFRFPIYHNFYGWFLSVLSFNAREKKYVWFGIAMSNTSTDEFNQTLSNCIEG